MLIYLSIYPSYFHIKIMVVRWTSFSFLLLQMQKVSLLAQLCIFLFPVLQSFPNKHVSHDAIELKSQNQNCKINTWR